MSKPIGKTAKSLLILDLNGLLGFMTKKYTKFGSQGVYNEDRELLSKPIHLDNKIAIY